MAVTNEGLDWLEFSRSDDAQQLSACAWVSTRADPELCESPLCIGHSAPSAQHAMRASGVGSHPAQIAAFPATSPMAKITADTRLMRIRTTLRMLKPGQSVKPTGAGASNREKPRRSSNHDRNGGWSVPSHAGSRSI